MTVTLQQLLSAYNGYLGARLTTRQIDAYAAELAARRASGWYAQVPQAGDRLPPIDLPGLGESDDLLSNGPLILKFYRSHLCPFCMLEIKAYQRVSAQLTATQLVAISSDRQATEQTSSVIDRLTFPIVHDDQSRIARALGLTYLPGPAETEILHSLNIKPQRWMTLPALLVVNTQGQIVFAYADADPSQRADPDAVLAEVKRYEVTA